MHADHAPHSPHRLRGPVALCIALAVVAVVAYAHGAAFWYAPLAVVGVVLAHVLVFGAITWVMLRHARGGGHAHDESMLLHRPRQYDRLARFILLGREAALRSWMLDLGGVGEGSAVLDVGAGTGTLLVAAAGRVGASGAVKGLEPSAEMRAHARQKALAAGVSIELVDGSAAELPFPDQAFDAVFCTLVLHHLPDAMHERALVEMCRVLRPGGRVVIVEWQQPTSLLSALLSPLFMVSVLHGFGARGSLFDRLGIEARLRDLGLASVTREAFGPGGSVGAVVGQKA